MPGWANFFLWLSRENVTLFYVIEYFLNIHINNSIVKGFRFNLQFIAFSFLHPFIFEIIFFYFFGNRPIFKYPKLCTS